MKKGIEALLCMAAIVVPVGLHAKELEREDTSNVVISFDLTTEDRFTYEVKVNEGGYLIDGSQRITNGTVAYELSVGQTKEFKVETERGYEVKEIRDNGKLLNTEGNRIKIAGVSAKSILEVRYGKIEDSNEADKPIPPNTSDTPDNSQGGGIKDTENQGSGLTSVGPETGDTLKISEYICLMLMVLYGIYVSRKGIDTRSVEDIVISKDIKVRKETLKEEKKDEE